MTFAFDVFFAWSKGLQEEKDRMEEQLLGLHKTLHEKQSLVSPKLELSKTTSYFLFPSLFIFVCMCCGGLKK